MAKWRHLHNAFCPFPCAKTAGFWGCRPVPGPHPASKCAESACRRQWKWLKRPAMAGLARGGLQVLREAIQASLWVDGVSTAVVRS